MAESKVTIPKQIAEAIEKLRAEGRSNWYIMYQAEGAVLDGPRLDIKRWAFEGRGKSTPDLLMGALVNGYEIERTPHEKLREYHLQALEDSESPARSIYPYGKERREAIETTLSILGITVEGIND